MISVNKIIVLFVLLSIQFVGYSQCAMCKAVVESGDPGVANGVNNGIIYLMFIPYLLIGTVGFLIYRHYKNNKLTD